MGSSRSRAAASAPGTRIWSSQVHDPDVREKLTPQYGLGCKRPSFSNEYLATFNRDNVLLETTPIEAITSGGVRTADGALHEIDVLVLATGFKVFDQGNMPPFSVHGRRWRRPRAILGGEPIPGLRGRQRAGLPEPVPDPRPLRLQRRSYFTLIENQMRHIVRCLSRARQEGATAIEVTPEANARYFERMLGRRGSQIFFQPSCSLANSYYFDSHGDVPFRASPTLEAAWRSARFDLDDYRFTRVRERSIAAA